VILNANAPDLVRELGAFTGETEMTRPSVNLTTKKRKYEILGTIIHVNGRTIGQVINGAFVKDIKTRHMLTTPPAIANDIQALHDAERAGAVYCVFTNTDTGIVYRAQISKIWALGKRINFGYGEQIMLTLSHWMQERDANFINNFSDVMESSEPSETAKPLFYKSNTPVGVTFNGEKQLDFLGGRK